MSKTKRFDIRDNEPSGTTFTAKQARFAGDSQTKRKARFGIGDGDPTGTTFEPDKSHIDFPKADVSVRESKVESKSSGQGKYTPNSKGPQNFGGSIAVGKSARK